MATYRDAGVDLNAAEAVVDTIEDAVTATWGDRVVGRFGSFASGIRLPVGYANPVLMLSTDGVGTKAEVARRADNVEGLGWDLVAMCIDDLVAAGATPIAMTDYIAVGTMDVELINRIVSSIAAACAAADVALIGGETAEHPGVMDPGTFDLAGTALGVVEDGRQIDGSAITPGDVIVGLASPNLRSNGFSLVRSVVLSQIELTDELPGTGEPTGDVLLAPSVLYTPSVLGVLSEIDVFGMAHITGGGLGGNIVRILPPSCDAEIDTSSWLPPAVFTAIQDLGNVPASDMFTTFNMGIGFVMVVRPESVDEAVAVLGTAGVTAGPIGTITDGSGRVRLQ